MHSPNIFSNENVENIPKDSNNKWYQASSKHTEHLNKVLNDNNIPLPSDDDDDEGKIAALEEQIRRLLIELQEKRNESSVKQLVNKVESGWAERERSALMKAEAAENRTQCAMAAAYRLAEEREVLIRTAYEVKAKCDVLTKENELLSGQVRSMATDLMVHERKVKDLMAERASHEAVTKTFNDKLEQAKKYVEEFRGLTTTTKGTVEYFQGEVDAMKTFEASIKEDLTRKDAIIEDMQEKLNAAAKSMADMAAKIGALEATRKPSLWNE